MDARSIGGFQVTPDHRAIAALGNGVEVDAEWIEPVDDRLLLEPIRSWASAVSASPIRIPGYFLRQPSSSQHIQPGEKVVLALHGGAYISLSAHPSDPTANIAKGLLQHTPAIKHVFSPEYRLSGDGKHPFPTALIDALSAYVHLVKTHGVSPKDIIVEGDSAGGNLALALTRYIIERRVVLEPLGLAPPGALLLMSPWTDIGQSHLPPSALPYHKQSDYLVLSRDNVRHQFARRLFIGPHGVEAADTNVYISPASKLLPTKPSFAGWPRTMIVCGGAEALADGIRTLKDRMCEQMGEGIGEGNVLYLEAPDGVHDYVCFEWHEPERSETLQAIAAWVGTSS
jgi:acetyl esterase/lipase